MQPTCTGLKPQFLPELSGIQGLFQREETAASWVIHVCAINLFLGRSVFLEGLRTGVPTWHSLIPACAFGPIGLLVHVITKVVTMLPLSESTFAHDILSCLRVQAFWNRVRRGAPVTLQASDGSIILMPYD